MKTDKDPLVKTIRYSVAALALLALGAAEARAGIQQTFGLDVDLVLPLEYLEEIDLGFGEFIPAGFAIECSYLLVPVKYVEAGAKLSYTRNKNSVEQTVSLNCLGMGALVRPRFPFETKMRPAPFVQVMPGLYRIVIGEEDRAFKETFFALECGAGLEFASLEFGANYNMGIDRKYSRYMKWISIFVGLRLGV